MDLSVQELEAAITLAERRPARGHEYALAPEVNLPAGIDALMIYQSATTINTGTLPADARQLLRSWRAQTTDPISDA